MNGCVGNLNSRMDEEQLKQLFLTFGDVQATGFIKDVFTGVSGDFG